MKKNKLSKVSLVSGILFIVLGLIVLVFADGLRRWYSGVFFMIIGIVGLLNGLRWRRVVNE